jgi:Flp pilus assembly pilin Flp
MLKLYIWLKDLLRIERGQDMVEYALITVIISVAIVLATVLILAPAFETWAEAIAGCISDPSGDSCFPVV